MPDTNGYLFLGLVVILAILSLYLGSLVVRFQNALKDIDLLERLRQP